MRVGAVLAVSILSISVVAAGCGRKETYQTPEGEVTIEQSGGKTEVTVETDEGSLQMSGDEGKMTIQTAEGTAVVTSGSDVGEEDIGIPFYPGASAAHSMKHTQSDEGVEKEFIQVHLTTKDDFSDVAAFYREKLPSADVAGQVETAEIKMMQLSREVDGVNQIVIVSRDKGDDETRIVLNSASEVE